MKRFFKDANGAAWGLDLKGTITIVNKACEKLTGYSSDELIGKDLYQLLTPESIVFTQQMMWKLLAEEVTEWRHEQYMIRKDGTKAVIEMTTHLVKPEGKPKAFRQILRDVTEERRLRESLRVQIHKALIAQEDERSRIARELHDDIAQSILLISRQLDNLITEHSKLSPRVIEELEHIHNLAEGVYRNVQRYARDLRPIILDQMGLVAALNWLAEELSNEIGIAAKVRASTLPIVSPDMELVIFRIAQEALNNIRKHSEASELIMTVGCDNDVITMIVADNGKGFTLFEQTESLANEGKLGLLGMRERARLISGTLEIKSKLGSGTTIILRAPVGNKYQILDD